MLQESCRSVLTTAISSQNSVALPRLTTARARAIVGLLAIIILRGTMSYEGGTKFALRQKPGEKPTRVDIEETRNLLTPELYESHGKFYAVRNGLQGTEGYPVLFRFRHHIVYGGGGGPN